MERLRVWTNSLDQDWVDSANGFWSVLLLAVCSVGALLLRYVTSPIACWLPKSLTGSYESYVTNNCFMNEHYVHGTDNNFVVPYHLWIPLILFFQAMCFKIPNIIWHVSKQSISFNMEETVESLREVQTKYHETSPGMFKKAAMMFGSLLNRNRILLCILYLFVKCLYIVNLLGQLTFLTIYFRNYLLVSASSALGYDVESIVQPLLFKNVICEFTEQKLNNVLQYSIPCSLPIADAYEKMFVMLWYWVLLLSVLTILNLVLWAAFLLLPFLRDCKMAAYIQAMPGAPPTSSSVTRFIGGFLGIDGVWMLSMISRNSSELVAAELTQEMFRVFLESQPSISSGAVVHTGPEPASQGPGQAQQEPTPPTMHGIPLQEMKSEKPHLV